MELDIEAAQAITDSAGLITKEDFIKFGKDKRLVDFDDGRREEKKDEAPEWAPTQTSTNASGSKSSKGLFCCGGRGGSVSPEPEMDRVELAFRRMDKNKDGFLTWEEFSKVLSLSGNVFQNMFCSECKPSGYRSGKEDFQHLRQGRRPQDHTAGVQNDGRK